MPAAIDLTGHRAVVTGAGKGIGRSICLQFAGAGADVFAVSRTESDLDSLGEELRPTGVRYGYCVVDLRGKETAERIAAKAAAALGAPDVLVNNAGVAENAPATEVTEEQWDTTLDVNAKGAFFLSQALGRPMLESGWGRIVNVSSQGGPRRAGGACGLRREQGRDEHVDQGAGRRVGPARRDRERGRAYGDPHSDGRGVLERAAQTRADAGEDTARTLRQAAGGRVRRGVPGL